VKAETLVQAESSIDTASIAHDYVPCKTSTRLLAFAFDSAALGLCIFAGAILCWLVIGASISFNPLQPRPENGLLADASHVRVTTYLSTIISLCYFPGSWLTLSASLGQRLVGIRLHSARTGKPLKVSQALARWVLLGGPLWVIAAVRTDELGALLSLATLVWSGFLLVSTLRGETGRGAHDRWTGSVVTSVSRASQETRQLQTVKPNVR
jgi:RDD family protein